MSKALLPIIMSAAAGNLDSRAGLFRSESVAAGWPIRSGVPTRDGRIYERGPNGNLVRVSPRKPWANKNQRKAVLRERREERAEA